MKLQYIDILLILMDKKLKSLSGFRTDLNHKNNYIDYLNMMSKKHDAAKNLSN